MFSDKHWDNLRNYRAGQLFHKLQNLGFNDGPNGNYTLADDHGEWKRIRLDWEVTDEMMRNQSDLDLTTLMQDSIAGELADVFVFGDVNSADALLKTINGEKKLGVEFLDCEINRPQIFREYNVVRQRQYMTFYIMIRGRV